MNTASRCAIRVLFDTVILSFGALIICTMIGLLYGLMIYTEAILLDIKTLFAQVDRLSKQKPKTPKPSKKPKKVTESKPPKRETTEPLMLECCKQALDLHERLNGLMRQLADVMSFIVLMTATPWTILICTSLFTIEKYAGVNFLDLQVPIVSIFFALELLLIIFYLGQKIHSNLMDLSDTIYQTEWYRYPRNVRRFVLLMMLRSQQPFYLSALGIMALHLENYVRLLNWIYSAYMVLRSIG